MFFYELSTCFEDSRHRMKHAFSSDQIVNVKTNRFILLLFLLKNEINGFLPFWIHLIKVILKVVSIVYLDSFEYLVLPFLDVRGENLFNNSTENPFLDYIFVQEIFLYFQTTSKVKAILLNTYFLRYNIHGVPLSFCQIC